ncbi:hypothetical protein [Nostoc sp. DedSLP04]|uniref:hypothetical protein n=1 Tax=Nostoc sp. DedSLP04 TaxID=3075401 RepID=UPI002AD57EE0|nr:hypothetical protein [Nostoc sp. DedSLP04]MDZ8031713.1 hypothetical protein [Nostoc sp. DedSLP04]
MYTRTQAFSKIYPTQKSAIEAYNCTSLRRSDRVLWYKVVATEMTVSDRISALSLLQSKQIGQNTERNKLCTSMQRRNET